MTDRAAQIAAHASEVRRHVDALLALVGLAGSEPRQVGVSMTPGAIRAREYRARQRTRARTDERTQAHAPCADVRTRAHEPCAPCAPEASSETAKNPATTGEIAESATVADAHAVRTPCAGGVRGGLFLPDSKTLSDTGKTEDKSARKNAHAPCAPCARTVRGVRTDRAPEPISWTPESGWSGITDADREGWRVAYPDCDLDRQLAAMTEWLRGNPAKARRASWRRFVAAWLARSQERGGDAQRQPRRLGVGVAHPAQSPIPVRVYVADGPKGDAK